MTGEINKSAKCFVGTVNGEIAVFGSFIHFPHNVRKTIKMIHRIVVLPDFQGIGLSRIMINFMASICKDDGYSIRIVTSHPGMIGTIKKDDNWKCKRSGRVSKSKRGLLKNSVTKNRFTTSWEFVE